MGFTERILLGREAHTSVPEAHTPRMMNLAVVDDDSGVRNGLGRLLRACGHHVQLFSSAEDFLAQSVSADCVIVDVQLPGLSGIELERRLRGLGRAAPIVFITAQDNPGAREPFWRAPCLRKPFDLDRLLDAIAEASSGIACAQDARPTWISPEVDVQTD